RTSAAASGRTAPLDHGSGAPVASCCTSASRQPAGSRVMAMLEMIGVSKTYGAGEQMVHALRDISLAVAAGELVAVMGRSGSGKRSLLTIAGTLEDATSGDVRIDGAVIGELRAGG